MKQISNTNKIISISPKEAFVYIIATSLLKVNCENETMSKRIYSSVFIYNIDSKCSIYIDNSLIPDHSNINLNSEKHKLNLFLSYSISSEDLIKKEIKNFNIKPINELQSEFIKLKNQVKLAEKGHIEVKKEKIEHENYWIDILIVIAVYSAIALCLISINLYHKYKQRILYVWSRIRDACLSRATNV